MRTAASPSPPCSWAIAARLVGTALLVLALVPLPAGAAPADTTGTVVGWVRDSLSGRALPYASVVVQGTHLGAMADTSGWFRLAGVPAGDRVIQALALGFRRGATPVRVRPARTDTVWLRLHVIPITNLKIERVAPHAALTAPANTTGTIVGWVTDCLSGKPVFPARLWPCCGGGAGAVTDRAGWYEMKLPAGRYNVRVDGQSPYPAIPVPILVRPGKVDTIRIRMLSEKDAFAIRPRVIVSEDRRGGTGTIMGWVRDSETGKPVQYANVVVPGMMMGIQVDGAGGFCLPAVPVGEHRVRAMADGYQSVERPVVVRLTVTDTVEFQLEPILQVDHGIRVASLLAPAASTDTTGTIVGWLRDSLSGKGLSHARFWPCCGTGTEAPTVSNGAGRFELHLPAGRYDVRVLADPPYQAAAVPVLVRPGMVDTVRIRMLRRKDADALYRRAAGEWRKPHGSIVGRVRDRATGSPMPLGVSIVRLGSRQGATTDRAGRYRISGVPVGRASLRATIADFLPLVDTVTVRAGRVSRLDFVMETAYRIAPGSNAARLYHGSIAGQVRDRQDGYPIPGADVEVIGRWWGKARTDWQGRYRLDVVPPGRAAVRVTAFLHKPFVDSVTVHVRQVDTLDLLVP